MQTLKSHIVSILFFWVTLVLIISEYNQWELALYIFKPILIPLILWQYLKTAKKVCYWYVIALVFAFLSNLFLLSYSSECVMLAIISFLFYRIATIITVIKVGSPVLLLPLVLATLPFIFIFSYLIYIIIPPDNPNFYPSIINDLIISIFSGLGLSQYVMYDNKQNSWLIISTLLFTFLVVVFMIQHFYLSNIVFQPVSALVFSLGHYAFYMFMKETESDENQTMIDLP
ncbi:hypothetical protein KIH23_05385 [Flavobacterium sp. CYK-55]|uniref:lysoplasmalogenase family protein n=1 Tax=Flavobacterium sp. CYK-55 TaxID=2835529 RepID=UPI001BCCCF9B|nr:lysoplasmalogenase family protein [Flavobacterium sp. CYK-55]MBS7786721.1 hypothetical protein [Flavobacterium sp. CYK-55]